MNGSNDMNEKHENRAPSAEPIVTASRWLAVAYQALKAAGLEASWDPRGPGAINGPGFTIRAQALPPVQLDPVQAAQHAQLRQAAGLPPADSDAEHERKRAMREQLDAAYEAKREAKKTKKTRKS